MADVVVQRGMTILGGVFVLIVEFKFVGSIWEIFQSYRRPPREFSPSSSSLFLSASVSAFFSLEQESSSVVVSFSVPYFTAVQN
jgi:hypothetical protein